MFIGHFGVGLAAKKIAPQANLGIFFICCQLLDLVWPVLVLVGVEHVSVDHAATVVTPFDFSHYPYSHSLLMTLVYSVGGAALAWFLWKSVKASLAVAGVIASHWVLDFVTHRADLPLAFSGEKVGLGLWNSLTGTLILELGIFIGGICLYLNAVKLVSTKQRVIFWSLIGFLLLAYFGNIFGPKVPLDTPAAAIAGPALSMWLLIWWAYAADRERTASRGNK